VTKAVPVLSLSGNNGRQSTTLTIKATDATTHDPVSGVNVREEQIGSRAVSGTKGVTGSDGTAKITITADEAHAAVMEAKAVLGSELENTSSNKVDVRVIQ